MTADNRFRVEGGVWRRGGETGLSYAQHDSAETDPRQPMPRQESSDHRNCVNTPGMFAVSPQHHLTEMT